MSLKLHLGCGPKKIHGFVNVDIRSEVNPDVVDDVFTLKTQRTNSAFLIYACHVLEHSPRHSTHAILGRWLDILRPGGMLRISVPDLAAAFEWYMATKNLGDVLGFIYGGQKPGEYDAHNTGWDEKSLTSDLFSAGFTAVRRYDWRETEHAYVDDYSMAALPKLGYFTRKLGGLLDGKQMSLNMEARKP